MHCYLLDLSTRITNTKTMMIGRSAMSIKTTQVTNVVNIGWGWGLALICFQEKKGGTFSNYGNSVGRSGHLE